MEEFEAQGSLIYALDIGTRGVVGVVGRQAGRRFQVLALEMAEHEHRTMIDGQIDDIAQVGELAAAVTERLERKLKIHLERVCVAAAGRALRTEKGSFALELNGKDSIRESDIAKLETGAVSQAEEQLQTEEEVRRQFFLVGYTVAQYRLDDYPLSTLLGHSGRKLEADVVATFLPGEVVESLYAAMRAAGLQVSGMTLEPIAAMNAALPVEIRLLNLALVDIGAGTTDIAICRDGSVVGYTMTTLAGDEITEEIMRKYLVDFQTAEKMKRQLSEGEGTIHYGNILGMEEDCSAQELGETIRPSMERLCQAVGEQVLALNEKAPSALFLAGGGSKLLGLKNQMAQQLGMDENRVAVAGSNFAKSVFSDELDLVNPEYTTPLGIAVSAGMGLLNDSYVVELNGESAKLFRSGVLTLRDILLMNGYTYTDMLARSGKSLTVELDGRKVMLRGKPGIPAILTLNGKEAAITQVIHAGDKISFTPAVPGEDAKATVADLFRDQRPRRVLVNNQEAGPDTPLHQEDKVLTLELGGSGEDAPPVLVRQKEEEKPQPEPEVPQVFEPVRESAAEVQPEPAPQAQAVSQAQPVPQAEPQPEMQAVPEENPQLTEPVRPVQPVKPVTVELPPVTPWPAGESEKKEETPGAICITLNGEQLDLPAKPDGVPYYLMDLLERTGIDFDHLESPVRMEINDEESNFTRELKNGDEVMIFLSGKRW